MSNTPCRHVYGYSQYKGMKLISQEYFTVEGNINVKDKCPICKAEMICELEVDDDN